MLERIHADVHRVRARIFVVLLAVAVMASIAVAAIRISDASGDHPDSVQKQISVYGTTAALAAETRAKLKSPPGFKRSSDCSVAPETVCFVRDESRLLDPLVMERYIADIGATLYSTDRVHSGVPPIVCRTASLRVRLSFQGCDAEATIGHERLMVSAHSAILVAHGSLRPTRRPPKGFAFPAEIHVYVIGHFLHDGTAPRGPIILAA
jgi:hypothetical protein